MTTEQPQDLTLYTGATGTELQLARKPEDVIADAIESSKRLKKIVTQTGAIQKIGESEHLKLQAWQTLGNFYGLVGRIVRTEFVEFGPIAGFKAYADLVHVASQKVVSSAEAMCLNDEEKWSDRPKYEYHYLLKDGSTSAEDPGWSNMQTEPNPKKPGKQRPVRKKVKVGMEKVPMYQLLSMAETRATSKVHSMALRWIVVLAGFAPTPAEEADPGASADDDDYSGEPEAGSIQQPKQGPAAGRSAQTSNSKGPADQPANGVKLINQEQINKIWGAGYSANQYHKVLDKSRIDELIRHCGYARSDQIPDAEFERVYQSVLRNEPWEPDPGTGIAVQK